MFNRKQQKYLRIIKNHKDNLHITELENKLSNYNFKTCDLEKFKFCIKEKNKINESVLKSYEDLKLQMV